MLSSDAAVDPNLSRRVETSLKACVDAIGLRSAYVAVLEQNSIGEAAIGPTSPFVTDARFRIACLLKPITAMILLQLQDENLLDSEDPISNYLTEIDLNAEGRRIKVRHLLAHTSGLADYALYRLTLDEPAADAGSLLRRMWQSGACIQQTGAGEFASYSSLGYLCLEAIIESVTGQTFEQVLEERILRPLRIGTISGSSTVHYFRPGVGRNIAMTCRELVRVVDALYRALSVSSSSFHSMLATAERLPGYSYSYAAWSWGWAKFNTSVYGHNGDHGPTRLSVRFMPADRKAIAVACDASSSLRLLYSLSRKLLDVSITPACESEAPQLDDPLLACGSYIFPEETGLEVISQGSTLEGICLPGAARVVFKRVPGNQYVCQKTTGATLGFYSFVRSREGNVLLWDGTRLTPKSDPGMPRNHFRASETPGRLSKASRAQ